MLWRKADVEQVGGAGICPDRLRSNGQSAFLCTASFTVQPSSASDRGCEAKVYRPWRVSRDVTWRKCAPNAVFATVSRWWSRYPQVHAL